MHIAPRAASSRAAPPTALNTDGVHEGYRLLDERPASGLTRVGRGHDSAYSSRLGGGRPCTWGDRLFESGEAAPRVRQVTSWSPSKASGG